MWLRVHSCSFQISWGYISAKNWQNWMISDLVVTNINKGDVYSETQCRVNNLVLNLDLNVLRVLAALAFGESLFQRVGAATGNNETKMQ